ncbi:MAG: ABC transporter permease, partial [Thermodesulfobacteriota bacterium]|nr:ABC transporter permease [Thermodesulfobacteriota bacterium]
MGLRKYIIQRLVQVAVIFFVILTVLFLLFRLAPGDPVSRMVDPDMTPEEAELLISELGLDQPLSIQYIYYVKNFFTGHYGNSFNYGQPVAAIILDRLPNTIILFT